VLPLDLLIPTLNTGLPKIRHSKTLKDVTSQVSGTQSLASFPRASEHLLVDEMLPALGCYALNALSAEVDSKQPSAHVIRGSGSGDPRWGDGVDRESCLTEFQRLKAILHCYQGEHRFHNFAVQSKMVPSESAARRFIYKLRAGTELGGGLCTLSVAADALLAGQFRAMAGLSIAVQRGLLPQEYIGMALNDELLAPVPAIPKGTEYLSGCVFLKNYHWLLQPLMEGEAAQVWRRHVQAKLASQTSHLFSSWFDSSLVPVCSSGCKAAEKWRRSQHQLSIEHFTSAAPAELLGPPIEYIATLQLLREIDVSGRWPEISTGRMKVIKSSTLSENGGNGGSFSIGSMPPPLEPPKSNRLFPDLMRCAFELENALHPERPSSSTIAINKHAVFLPHVDSGAGAGQGMSLIVGLGNYTGGELVVEGKLHDIRYKPLQFNGWTQRHWTLPFEGERFSLVWFTPKGCESMPGVTQSMDSVLT